MIGERAVWEALSFLGEVPVHRHRVERALGAAVLFYGALTVGGCGKNSLDSASSDVPPISTPQEIRCDVDSEKRYEVVDTSAPAAPFDNVRRVYAFVGPKEEERRVLICRKADTNFDGALDVVRKYDEEGKKQLELADANYDGKVDTWITFLADQVKRIEIDTDGDGTANEVRIFVEGSIARIQKDVNGDGVPDAFEVYHEGRLQRRGIDADFDGRVDRWERDEYRFPGKKGAKEKPSAGGGNLDSSGADQGSQGGE